MPRGGQNKKPEGWWTNGNGYIEGHVWEGDKKRRVKKHRHIVEQKIGRRLEPHEDVHHIDGDKQNNAIENLQVIPHGDHTRITNSERTYRKGYRLNLSEQQRADRSDWMKRRHAIARKQNSNLKEE